MILNKMSEPNFTARQLSECTWKKLALKENQTFHSAQFNIAQKENFQCWKVIKRI